jgi:serine/threonine protein kinase/formylglycine-generating enzyme required for sulfatase activity/dienelactone hydrolase
MDSERWKQIDSLLQSALEHAPGERAEFLRQACAGDEALEREVRSLLASQQEAGSFLDSPAMEVAARTIAQSDLTGRNISHYKILEMLGAGGMGVVYKAFDTKLDRFVALKFLPQHLRHDGELKRRLTEEARAASALDHSNIVVIYEIDEVPGGDLFIAMAFHEGVTLRERIGAGLPVPEALQIARQIASGLAKAHERGIFHRDIKPSNVIVAKDGVARIIDFGLAKSSEATATLDGSSKGTPLYMSPEQASGKAVDFRTDLWSLGAVLYEMLAGRPPFSGDQNLQIMHAIVHNSPPRLREERPDLPPEIDLIVSRALQKDPAKRYQSAADMVRDLSASLTALDAPARKPASLRAIPALALILLVAGVSIWFYQRSEKRHWAREQAIPEIARLARENKPLAAFLLEQKAQKYLPGDPQFAQIADGLTHVASVRSSPPGATVEIKDYLSPGDPWFALGTTPLDNIKIPLGYLRWRVSKTGVGEYTGAPITEDVHGPRREFNFPLEAIATAPQGMVPVPAVRFDDFVWSLGELGPYDLPLFYLDRFEVTNRQYQDFVDHGGYQKREYWKEKLIRDRQELSWEQAMDLFRDASGRPGPSTWEAGHYPSGQADYPVGGVSWYEAAAYAEFAGKSLPVIAQWYLAAPSSIAKHIIQQSNFAASGLAPAGKYQGLGPWGAYDMAGNVAEWRRNEGGGNSRYILGGAWNTSSSEYFEPGVLPPFDRSANSGFRCVRNTAALPAAATAEVRPLIRDFSKAKPAPDEVFRIYKAMYAYDRTPLNARLETIAQDSTDWRKEKITFDAAYGKERMAAYLFLPASVRPPYQTVVFFPRARGLDIPASTTLGDMKFIDYVIKSGRAVLYPVYKGTYERPGPDNTPTTAAGRETLIQQSKDLGRSIDYLETRPDIDRTRIGYLGVSMGAALGVILTAVEDRFKAVVFLDGGFFVEKMLPGTDQADFAPRLKAPALMIGGKYDWIFLGKVRCFACWEHRRPTKRPSL